MRKMFCNQCGTELADGAVFCPNCGKRINDASQKQQEVFDIPKPQQEYQAERKTEKDIFVDSSEEEIAVLGAGYLSNFIHGDGLTAGFAIVSNKRFYFRGKGFVNTGKGYVKVKEEQCVDLPDITSSGFIYSSPTVLLLLAILASIAEVVFMIAPIGSQEEFVLVGLLVAGVLWVGYFLLRKCIYEIRYAGGSIGVNASMYGMEQIRAFDKDLRRAKDKAVGVRQDEKNVL